MRAELALTGQRVMVTAITLAAVCVGHHVVLGPHGGGYKTRVAVTEFHAGLVGVYGVVALYK